MYSAATDQRHTGHRPCHTIVRRWIRTLALLPAALLCSCSGDSRAELASQMLQRARIEADNGNFIKARIIIDSIDSVCPDALEARREGMALMPAIREGIINQEYQRVDSLIAVNTLTADTLSAWLTRVENPIEPYIAVKGQRFNYGLSPRLMPDGAFYMISVLPASAPAIRHTSVTVIDGTAEASSSSVARDGERNAVTDGKETVHYIGEEIDSVGSFIAARPGRKLTLRYNGEKGRTYTVALSEADSYAIARAYRYARTITTLKLLRLQRESLERQLEVARNQNATLRQEPNR